MSTFSAWYADAQRMESRHKWVIYSDRGEARVAPGTFSFKWRVEELQSRQVEEVEIVRAKVAYWTGLVYVAAAILFLAVVAFLMPPSWAWPTLVAAVALGLIAGIFAWVQQVFIRIAGVDVDGARFIAFIRQEDRFPSRAFTQRIARELEAR